MHGGISVLPSIFKRRCTYSPLLLFFFTLMWDWGGANNFDVDTGSTLMHSQCTLNRVWEEYCYIAWIEKEAESFVLHV